MNLNSVLRAEATKWLHHTSMTTAVYPIEYENGFVWLCFVVVISFWMDLCVFYPCPPWLPHQHRDAHLIILVSIKRPWIILIKLTSTKMTSSNGKIFRITGRSVGNSLVTGEFPTQRPVMWSFDVFFDLHLNKQVNNCEADESRHHHDVTPSWCYSNYHHDVTVITNTQQNIYYGYDW